jgi:hypothetical protein
MLDYTRRGCKWDIRRVVGGEEMGEGALKGEGRKKEDT